MENLAAYHYIEPSGENSTDASAIVFANNTEEALAFINEILTEKGLTHKADIKNLEKIDEAGVFLFSYSPLI